MKVGLMSDMHLEFGAYDGPWGEGDLLLLSGDIMVAAHLAAFNNLDRVPSEFHDLIKSKVAGYDAFMDEACRRYEHVAYIMGNHEHYGSNVAHTLRLIHERYARYSNLQVIEKEALQIEDVIVIGATLWTDFNGHDAETRHVAESHMNDYRQIWIGDADEARNIYPDDIYEDHLVAVECIQHYTDYAREHGLSVIVMTHHAGCKDSTHPRYRNERLMNGCYSTDLTRLMGGPVKLWVHGHTHDSYDYVVDNTRVVCNPRGYAPSALNRGFKGDLELLV